MGNMRILILTVLVCLTSCTYYEVEDYYSPRDITKSTQESAKLIKQRRLQAEQYSLTEKAEIFESKLTENFDKNFIFIPKQFYVNKPAKYRIDSTALLLSAIALKYHTTKDEKDKKTVQKIVDSIIAADTANGLDGFIPYKVKIHDNQVIQIDNNTHENVYAQLFFAYINILKYVPCSELKQKIINHSTLILRHFAKHDFILMNDEGKESPYSDISLSRFSILHNRKLSLLALLECGLHIAEDSTLKEKLKKVKAEALDLGYEEDIMELHTKLLNLEFPTHSSSWLNMLKIYNAWHASKKIMYRNAFDRLYERYQDERNPFFELIGNSIKGQQPTKQLEDLLATFPIELTNAEIINSQNSQLKKRKGNYVKLKAHWEAIEVLPFYQRPLNNYLWKRNPMILDENFKSRNDTIFTGVDFLQAYWMMRALQVHND